MSKSAYLICVSGFLSIYLYLFLFLDEPVCLVTPGNENQASITTGFPAMLPNPKDAQNVQLQFIQDVPLYDREKPYCMTQGEEDNLPSDSARSNIILETRITVPVHDLRGEESALRLEEDGFMYYEHPTLIGTRFDDDAITNDITELVDWLQEHTGSERAICYDYRAGLFLLKTACLFVNFSLHHSSALVLLPPWM